MRLSDIMSHMELSVWPQAALVLFLGVFIVIAWRTFRGAGALEQESLVKLPFDDGAIVQPSAVRSGKGQA